VASAQTRRYAPRHGEPTGVAERVVTPEVVQSLRLRHGGLRWEVLADLVIDLLQFV
jgi:hypothetical protein